MFESLAAAEAEYSSVLDLRECLRVEEITTEMQMEMGQLYLDPPKYHAYQEHLVDVRILIKRACHSLSYIQTECSLRGLKLDPESIGARRIACRPSDHPYYAIAPYLKPNAWEKFNNYSAFIDSGQNSNEDIALTKPDAEANDSGVVSDDDDDDDGDDEDEVVDEVVDDDSEMKEVQEVIDEVVNNDDDMWEEQEGEMGRTSDSPASRQSSSLPEPEDEVYYTLTDDYIEYSGSSQKTFHISEDSNPLWHDNPLDLGLLPQIDDYYLFGQDDGI